MEANKYSKRLAWKMFNNMISTTTETEVMLGILSPTGVWDVAVNQWEDEALTVELLLLKLTRRFLDG